MQIVVLVEINQEIEKLKRLLLIYYHIYYYLFSAKLNTTSHSYRIGYFLIIVSDFGLRHMRIGCLFHSVIACYCCSLVTMGKNYFWIKGFFHLFIASYISTVFEIYYKIMKVTLSDDYVVIVMSPYLDRANSQKLYLLLCSILYLKKKRNNNNMYQKLKATKIMKRIQK